MIKPYGEAMASPTTIVASAPTQTDLQGLGQDRDGDARMRLLMEMCGQLSTCASGSSGVHGVLDCLSERTGHAVAIAGLDTTELVRSGAQGSSDVIAVVRARTSTADLDSALAAASLLRRSVEVRNRWQGLTTIVAPVVVRNEVSAFLLAVDDGHNAIDKEAMLFVSEHAATVCGLIFENERAVQIASGRARSELVEGLIVKSAHDKGEAVQWARHLGYDESLAHAVLVLALPHPPRDNRQVSIEGVLRGIAPDAMIAVRARGAVVIVPGPTSDRTAAVSRAQRIATRCVQTLSPTDDGRIRVGIGNAYLSAADLWRSHGEAQRALAVRERGDRSGSVTLFSSLGIHRLLAAYPNASELRAFGEDVLGEVLAEDLAKSMDYLPTLATYFAENRSLARAAHRLHVHPNTVTYRIRRIEQLSGLDLNNQQDRLVAEVSVEILLGMTEHPYGADARSSYATQEAE
jgi:sugar diacid utilization regulator